MFLAKINEKNLSIFCLPGYDSAFIQGALSHPKVKRPSILPANSQRVKSISFSSYVLRDSLAHLGGSLSVLAEDLRQSGHKWDIVRQCPLVQLPVSGDNDLTPPPSPAAAFADDYDILPPMKTPWTTHILAQRESQQGSNNVSRVQGHGRGRPRSMSVGDPRARAGTSAFDNHQQPQQQPQQQQPLHQQHQQPQQQQQPQQPATSPSSTSLNVDENKVSLMTCKGYFPYTFAKSIQEMLETTSLPPPEAFANDLTESAGLTEDEYRHAQRVWSTFGCTNLLDYMLLYLRTDTYVLAEVFNAYRNESIDGFGLDPAHMLGLPSLAFDSMLRMCKVQLELMKSKEMYLKLEAAVCGGNAYTALRYAKHVPPMHPGGEGTHMLYVDANSL